MFGKIKEKLASETVQKSLGLVADLAKKHLGPKLVEIAQDETKVKPALAQLYTSLPSAVSSVCSQEQFVNLCWEHRDKIFPNTKAA